MRTFSVLFAMIFLTVSVMAESALKIVTVNVWSGLTYSGGFRSGTYESAEERAFRYGLLVNELRELDADVIGVNEANMLPGYAKRLARDLDYDYIYAVRYGGVRLGQVGFPLNLREGEVILAKRYLNLAPAGSRELNRGYAGNFATFHFRNKTQVLAGRITVGEREVYLYSTHWTDSEFASGQQLGTLVELFAGGKVDGREMLARVSDAVSGHEIRREEAEKTVAYINEIAGEAPVVLMGTFNALPKSDEIAVLGEAGFIDAWTRGRGAGYTRDGTRNINILKLQLDPESPEQPRRDRVDYIFYRGEGLKVTAASIALDDATFEIHPSDHFAVVADLESSTSHGMDRAEAIEHMNHYGAERRPFLFIVDFGMEDSTVVPLDRINPEEILFDVNGTGNVESGKYVRDKDIPHFDFACSPVSYDIYKQGFDEVHRHFVLGNTFLLNLTFPTPVQTDLTLAQIFTYSRAKYRLLVDEKFVVFSPECFIKITGNLISSYPMKGTIDAAVPDAARVILDDPKETAEHITIVDLIRNDIGIVAEQVRVRRFRYIDTLVTSEKILLQVSSEITGMLPDDFHRDLGTLLFKMLPAGSITGAPKKKTVEIITSAEGYNRGCYTGVFGYFDGRNLESAVMIRFIERSPSGDLFFKSGGGLTVYSDPLSEYQELIDKVYVPFTRNN